MSVQGSREGTSRSRPDAVFAIDLGTTEVKVGVISLAGDLLGSARARYPLRVDEAAGIAEQDANDWWGAIVAASRAALAEAGLAPPTRPGAPSIVAVAFDGHGPSLVATDRAGNPVAPVVTWLDRRPAAELARLEATTGLRGWSLGVLPAALWLERAAPEAARRARWYLNSWEHLGLRLSGRAALSLTPGQPVADPAALEEAGLAARKIPAPIAVGAVLDGLRSDPAAELGLPAGIPVVAGHVDAFASFNGAGLRDPGDAIDVGGTAGGFGVYTERPYPLPGLFSSPAPMPGLWSVGGAMAATGRALDWFRDAVLRDGTSTADLLTEAATVPPAADGLVFLPYLAGERSPLWDPAARGAFVGLTLTHGRPHLVRAILEAAALAIRHIAVPLPGAGVAVRAMVVCGGPAQSPLWNQLKADITGFTVEVPRILETAVVGSAVAGAVAVGAWPDLRSGIDGMVQIDQVLVPRPEHREVYDRLFESYVGLYPAISPVIRPLLAAVGGPGRNVISEAAEPEAEPKRRPGIGVPPAQALEVAG
jgi:xylulokinase